MRLLSLILPLLLLSTAVFASNITEENIVGEYRANLNKYLILHRSFKVTLTLDKKILIQEIHPKNPSQDIKDPSRISFGTYKLSFDSKATFIEATDVFYPDPDLNKQRSNIYFKINLYNAKVQDFERSNGTNIEISTDITGSKLSASGEMKLNKLRN